MKRWMKVSGTVAAGVAASSVAAATIGAARRSRDSAHGGSAHDGAAASRHGERTDLLPRAARRAPGSRRTLFQVRPHARPAARPARTHPLARRVSVARRRQVEPVHLGAALHGAPAGLHVGRHDPHEPAAPCARARWPHRRRGRDVRDDRGARAGSERARHAGDGSGCRLRLSRA
jgi:hypothetical protein